MERQGPHTPLRNIYLSSWLDGLNDHPAEKGEGKRGEREFEGEVRGRGKVWWRKCATARESRERVRSGEMLTISHLEEE